MDIKITVDIPALDRLVDTLNAQINQPAGNAASPQTDKPARTVAKDRTTSGSATAASEPSQETTGSSQTTQSAPSEAGATGTADAGTVDYKDVKKAILDLVAKKGRDAAVELLKKFDATKGEEIDKSRWGEFLTAAQAVLNG